MTLQEKNKAVVRGYLDDISNAGNFGAAARYFGPGLTFNGSSDVRAQMTRQLGVRAAFPDLRLSIEDQIAEGDRVVTRVTFRGTHRGEFAGVAPTGREVAFAGTAVDRLEDGKVVEMWHTANVHLLMQQIGASSAGAPITATPPAGESSA